VVRFLQLGYRHFAEVGHSLQLVESTSARPVRLFMSALAACRTVPLEECTVQAGPAASEEMRQSVAAMPERSELPAR
ncbi:transcriptional regulator, partial [Pseudomonas aeruginosa]